MRPHFFFWTIKRIKKPWRTSWLSSACQHQVAASQHFQGQLCLGTLSTKAINIIALPREDPVWWEKHHADTFFPSTMAMRTLRACFHGPNVRPSSTRSRKFQERPLLMPIAVAQRKLRRGRLLLPQRSRSRDLMPIAVAQRKPRMMAPRHFSTCRIVLLLGSCAPTDVTRKKQWLQGRQSLVVCQYRVSHSPACREYRFVECLGKFHFESGLSLSAVPLRTSWYYVRAVRHGAE